MLTRIDLIRLVVVCACVLLPAASVWGVIYVDAGAGGANDGGSWANAFNDLQDALDAAVAGDEIRIAEGTYKPSKRSNAADARSATFRLRNNVVIRGGYAGDGAADPDAHDISIYETILSGDIGTVSDKSDNCYHVVIGSGRNNTAVLDGVTITAGNADVQNVGFGWYGGGMYNSGGSPTVTNCTFRGNSAKGGSGMHNRSGSNAMVANCTFSGNSNTYDGIGGGMYNRESNPTITNCTFANNSLSDYAVQGAGMCNYKCNPTLTNCHFIGNMAIGHHSDGGGMFNYESSPTLISCTFSGNSAQEGGGMFNDYESSPNLVNCAFNSNTADAGGGIYNYKTVNLTMTNCALSENSATTYAGGAIFNEETSTLILTNCTFSGNSAPYGSEYLDTDQLYSLGQRGHYRFTNRQGYCKSRSNYCDLFLCRRRLAGRWQHRC